MNASGVYSDPHVRRRIGEYLGGSATSPATCAYLTYTDGCGDGTLEKVSPGALEWFFENELDIARSLLDRESLLIHLDIEYVNFDSPEAVYVDPWNAFEMQEPVIRVVEEWLTAWEIRPIHLITGRGHHFVWRVGKESPVAVHLAALGRAGADEAMEEESSEAAFAGLALVMEHVAHEIRKQASPRSYIPVEITALHVGPSTTSSREIVSIDISEYGDPMATRVIRVPFSRYRKAIQLGFAHAPDGLGAIPAMFVIPLHEMDWHQALKVRQDVSDIIGLARCTSMRIPLQEAGMRNLLQHYLKSDLRGFHEDYLRGKRKAESEAQRLPWEEFPQCVRHLFEEPNDCLLKPAGMQQVTRTLLALGWPPPQIARVIGDTFCDQGHRWGQHWDFYDPVMRSEFYVRLFSGLIATGADALVDFNCKSTQEKGFCFDPDGCSLARFRETLKMKRKV